jgi:nucleoid DNA-binding protein
MAEKKAKAKTKTEVYSELAAKTGMTKKEVASFMDHLGNYIKAEIGKKGPGIFQLPGLLKILRHEKKARPAREGINPRNPGEKIMYPAKPAALVVKVRPLKSLKDVLVGMKPK